MSRGHKDKALDNRRDYNSSPYRKLVAEAQKRSEQKFHSIAKFHPDKDENVFTASCKICNEKITINDLTNEIYGNASTSFCLSQQVLNTHNGKDFSRESKRYRRLVKTASDLAKKYDHRFVWVNGGSFVQVKQSNTYIARCRYCDVIAYMEISLAIIGGQALSEYCASDLPRGLSLAQMRQKLGQCETCGQPRGDDGTLHQCRQCANISNKKQKKNSTKVRLKLREAGKCVYCSNPVGEDGTKARCRECADFVNAKSRERQKALQASGKCISCPNQRDEGGTKYRCKTCSDKRRNKSLTTQSNTNEIAQIDQTAGN